MPKIAFENISSKRLFSDFITKIEPKILRYLANAGKRDIPQIEDLNLLS